MPYKTKDIPKLNDFNQLVDLINSSFYQASTENLNKAWYINLHIRLCRLGSKNRNSSIAL